MERHTPPPTDPLDDPLGAHHTSQGGYENGSYEPPRHPRFDPAAVFVILDGLRRVVPRELEGQLNSLIREFLLTMRSLIDWYLERLDRPEQEPRVEDIPID